MSGLLPYPFGPPPPPPGQMANSTSARIFVNGMALPAGQPFNQTVAYHQIQRALPSNVQMNFNIDHNSPGIHIHYHHHQVPAGNSLARVHRDRPQWSMPEGASPETKSRLLARFHESRAVGGDKWNGRKKELNAITRARYWEKEEVLLQAHESAKSAASEYGSPFNFLPNFSIFGRSEKRDGGISGEDGEDGILRTSPLPPVWTGQHRASSGLGTNANISPSNPAHFKLERDEKIHNPFVERQEVRQPSPTLDASRFEELTDDFDDSDEPTTIGKHSRGYAALGTGRVEIPQPIKKEQGRPKIVYSPPLPATKLLTYDESIVPRSIKRESDRKINVGLYGSRRVSPKKANSRILKLEHDDGVSTSLSSQASRSIDVVSTPSLWTRVSDFIRPKTPNNDTSDGAVESVIDELKQAPEAPLGKRTASLVASGLKGSKSRIRSPEDVQGRQSARSRIFVNLDPDVKEVGLEHHAKSMSRDNAKPSHDPKVKAEKSEPNTRTRLRNGVDPSRDPEIKAVDSELRVRTRLRRSAKPTHDPEIKEEDFEHRTRTRLRSGAKAVQNYADFFIPIEEPNVINKKRKINTSDGERKKSKSSAKLDCIKIEDD